MENAQVSSVRLVAVYQLMSLMVWTSSKSYVDNFFISQEINRVYSFVFSSSWYFYVMKRMFILLDICRSYQPH